MLSEDELDTIETVHKELEMIENVITRMANNSFMIKGWTITIFVALITFFNLKDLSFFLLIFALLAVVFLFGYLDAFYLLLERKYTSLYSAVRKKRIDYKNYASLFNLNAEEYNQESIIDVVKNKKYKLFYAKKEIKKKIKNSSFCYRKEKDEIIKRALKEAFKRNTIVIFYGSLLIFIGFYSIYSGITYKNSQKDENISKYEITIKEAEIEISNLEQTIEILAKKLVDLNNSITSNKEDMSNLNEVQKNIKQDLSDIKVEINLLGKIIKEFQVNSNN